eukprot:6204440-Pleurochrysis_carterae.AAC.1
MKQSATVGPNHVHSICMALNYKGEVNSKWPSTISWLPPVRTSPFLETSNPHTTVRQKLLWSTCSGVGLFTAIVTFVKAVLARCTRIKVRSSIIAGTFESLHSLPSSMLLAAKAQTGHRKTLDPLGHASYAVGMRHSFNVQVFATYFLLRYANVPKVNGATCFFMWLAAEALHLDKRHALPNLCCLS